jgi:hypothetical protein
MPHKHAYAERGFTTLTLPTIDQRYELIQTFTCACGEGMTCTSWSKNQGRHQSLVDLLAIKRHEEAAPHRKEKR